MIYQTIREGIHQQGTDCILTEYNSLEKYTLRGIFQPIGMKNKEHSQIEYTIHGTTDYSELLFIFNVPDKDITYENAVLSVEHNHHIQNSYYIKKCKPFYYKGKVLYYSAVVSPCSGEVVI